MKNQSLDSARDGEPVEPVQNLPGGSQESQSPAERQAYRREQLLQWSQNGLTQKQFCQQRGLSLDADFADIRTYPPDRFRGIIVMRPAQQDKTYVLEVFQRALRLFSTEPVERRLWLVEEERIRVRD